MEGQGTYNPWRLALAALALQGALALLLAFSDQLTVKYYHSTAKYLADQVARWGGNDETRPRLLFQSEWASRHAMSTFGGTYWTEGMTVRPGDVIAQTQQATAWGIPVDESLIRFDLMEKSESPSSLLPRLMDRELGAGYYSSGWGVLPFTWGATSGETVAAFRVEPPFRRIGSVEQLDAPVRWMAEKTGSGGNVRVGIRGQLLMGEPFQLITAFESDAFMTGGPLALILRPGLGPDIRVPIPASNSSPSKLIEVTSLTWPRSTHLPGDYRVSLTENSEAGEGILFESADPLRVEGALDRLEILGEHSSPEDGLIPVMTFRLTAADGVGRQIRIDPPVMLSRLFMVSALAYGLEAGQSQVVAEWILRDPQGVEIARWPLRAGVETAEWSAGRPDIAPRLRHKIPDDHETFHAGEFEGRPFKGYRFLARWDPGRAIRTGSIELSVSEGMAINVENLTLMTADFHE